jgi:hypothetical protein
MHPSSYLDGMMLTSFCHPALGLDIASRVMDVYVFEGDGTLIGAAVAVLASLEGRLYGEREDVVQTLALTGGAEEGLVEKPKWELGGEDAFMELVRSIVDAKGEGEGSK